jgi:hypothetical protein
MTCYMRHMAWLFDALDLENDKAERKRVDAALREVLATPADAHCPEVWAAIKALSDAERDALVPRVGAALRG